MLHGLTGTAEMMRPLAERLCPGGWDLLLPEAPFPHPERGFGWWLRDAPPTDPLDAAAIEQVEQSLAMLEAALPEEGPLIVGGFSQGSALAQELLGTRHADRIRGVSVLGGKSARPLELRLVLDGQPPRRLLSMHGSRDVMVPLWQAEETVEIFREAGWDLTLLRHEKGHMVDLSQEAAIRDWVAETAGY